MASVTPGASVTLGTQWNYVCTAQKPTVVTHSVVGHFTAPTDYNLILARGTRIEVHRIAPEGLEGVLDVPIYGRISMLELFKPPGQKKDLLFLATERYNFCVLEYDTEKGELVTKANGDLKDRVGSPRPYGQIGIIDPDCRMIGLQLFKGVFKVIPIDERGHLHEAFNIHMDEMVVYSMVFLANCALPSVALLSDDNTGWRVLRVYEISIKDKDFKSGLLFPALPVDKEAGVLVAVPPPNAGVLILGNGQVSYVSNNGEVKRFCKTAGPAIFKAAAQIDQNGSRYLLGDTNGVLHLLVLRNNEFMAVSKVEVVNMKLEVLGRTSLPQTISYLDNRVIFVGSCHGDSQLIKIHTQPIGGQPGNYLEVLDTFINLGSIVDFCVVDLERQGQGQIVTCSGLRRDSTLRVVRNGIGMLEMASIELAGIKGMWALRAQDHDAFDTYLVLAFVGSTVVLAIVGDELEESADFEGFDAHAQSLWCGNVVHEQVLQVTHKGVRLVDEGSKQLITEWRPPSGLQINVAAGNPQQIVVATGEGNVVYLEVKEGALKEVHHVQLPAEVSCLDITPIGKDAARADVAAVGTWKMELVLLELPTLRPILSEALPGAVIPRSVLFALFEEEPYVLVAMGDGHLVTFRLDLVGGGLGVRKVLTLGTKPISLHSFRSQGNSHVFAASDRPTIIYSSNRKLLYSNLNENEVNVMAPFSPTDMPEGLAIAKDGLLMIGNIDEVQKLHVQSIPLGMQARRISHQEFSRTFLVSLEAGALGNKVTLVLFDDQTFEKLSEFAVRPEEDTVCSIISTSLKDDPTVYYIVGTGREVEGDPVPDSGRILFFQVRDRTLHLVYEKEVKGAVFTLNSFQGKLLASVASKVAIFDWVLTDDTSHELVFECSHLGRIYIVSMATRGDFIAVGDLMRSVEVLHYNSEAKTLTTRARDYASTYMVALETLDDDTYLCSENSYNIFTLRKNGESATDEERAHLEVVGEFHMGELVNRFKQGSLVVKMADQDALMINTILFGTVNGVIGVVASLPQPMFKWFSTLQDALRKVVKGVGGFEHLTWRTFVNEMGPRSCKGFIDGDLIEQFLDLNTESQDKVAREMGGQLTREDIQRKVEEVSRCCH